MDGAVSDGASCTGSGWSCVPGTRTARQCDGMGNVTNTQDCGASGQVCAPNLGCVACSPGSFRCNPADPELTQQCSPDGSGYTDGARCDGASGEHCLEGHCGRPCEGLGNSYLGCEYWATSTANGAIPTSFTYAVAVANTQPYPVDVTVEGGVLTAPATARVMPNSVSVVPLPWITNLSGNGGICCAGMTDGPNCVTRSAQLPSGAYHLRSTGPVAAYQFNPLEYHVGNRFSFSNDASLLLPQNALGQQYLVFAYTSTGPPIGAPTDRCILTSIRGGFVTVVGAQTDATPNRVHVHATSPFWDPHLAGTMRAAGDYDYLLQRGEALQLVAAGFNTDLTGTLIQTSAPAAVYSGHDCVTVPLDRSACDHLEEQLFPTVTWGTRYAVSPVRYRDTTVENSVARIMAGRDGITLTFDGVTPPATCMRTLNRGDWCELQTTAGFQVTGTGPIAVAQYMPGLGDNMSCQCFGTPPMCPSTAECRGDPSMLLEPPVDQFRASYRILVPDSYDANFLTLVSEPGARLLLDEVPVSGDTFPVGSSLQARIVPVPPGNHLLRSADNVARFSVKVYGVAPFTSYAYPGGLDLAPIAPQ